MNLKASSDPAGVNLSQEDLLYQLTSRIRQSLDLQVILTATAAEVRSFLNTDRVKIYRFNADQSGEVIAESIREDRLPSLLGLNFPADDIPAQARELFLKARQRSIVDVASGEIGISPDPLLVINTQTETDIHYRPLDPCHAQYLTAMGVQASLVLPILHQHLGSSTASSLWGLLVAHHADPRAFSAQELQVVQFVVDQVSVAIAQATLVKQAKAKAQREASISNVAILLHNDPNPPLQLPLVETVNSLHASSGRLYISRQGDEPAQVYTCGEFRSLPDEQWLEENLIWRDAFNAQDDQVKVWAIADLHQYPSLNTLVKASQPTPSRSILVIALKHHQKFLGYLTLLRDEVDTETLWAGQFDPDQRQQQPRQSFEAWCELKRGQPQPWEDEDVELVCLIADQFSIALHQQLLYRQVQVLNTNLEQQVQEQIADLYQAARQQKALAGVINNIRASLDLETIFRTTAREVRQLLEVDRVGIFRFYPDSGFNEGEFVAEDVLPGFASALTAKIQDHCFGERYATHYQQGRIQAVDDINTAELQDCHKAILSQFQIRANLVVPLLQGATLWGLLCLHQCRASRHWQETDIDFTTQIAAQLSVALQQSELLLQTRQQTDQLAETLNHLKQTQTHLIQSEKMSSLGQLVAGVAHEINNPVNFIYGNLTHASQYTQDLLTLLTLYQQNYPHPAPVISEQAENVDIDFLVEDLPKMLASMKLGADRIRQIVLSLRNFSRLDQAEMKPVDIHEGIDSTLLILQYRLKPKSDQPGIQIVKEYGELPRVDCYAGQLNQVFMNVLGNAIDALEQYHDDLTAQGIQHKPAEITIRTRLSKHLETPSVRIQIADNGPGMPDAVRAHIFDPFFTTKPVGRGTGLGLSISYQIVVEKHGGSFSCVSEMGRGTEFQIEIPLKPLSQLNIASTTSISGTPAQLLRQKHRVVEC